MVRWVRAAAAMSRDDLEYVLAPDGSWGWAEGRLLKESDTEGDAVADDVGSSHERFHARVRQAWGVHRGTDVDLNRVPDADATCQYVMGAVARGLASGRQVASISESLGDELDVQSRLLPVGSLHAPFWLNLPTNTLVVSLEPQRRTRTTAVPGSTWRGSRSRRRRPRRSSSRSGAGRANACV